jgi:hypothetical protein
MSSDWAKWTTAEIKEYNPAGILIPIINYADAVSLGLRNKVCNFMSPYNFSYRSTLQIHPTHPYTTLQIHPIYPYMYPLTPYMFSPS